MWAANWRADYRIRSALRRKGSRVVTKTVILGAEYDQELRRAVVDALKQQGATTICRDYGVGGSQELETLEIELDSHMLVLESETYVGLSLTGDDAVVDRIVSLVGVAKQSTQS